MNLKGAIAGMIALVAFAEGHSEPEDNSSSVVAMHEFDERDLQNMENPALSCQFYVGYKRMRDNCLSVRGGPGALQNMDCFSGFTGTTDLITKLCPGVRRAPADACVEHYANLNAARRCEFVLDFDASVVRRCDPVAKNLGCQCYHACIEFITGDFDLASGGGSCCSNLCDDDAGTTTTTTTTPPPTTAR